MSRRAEQLSLADVVVLGISPALLIGLIVSLAYFILEVGYQGQYPERLRFILFLFAVASVLISRISMTMGRAKAVAYAGCLAIATFLALARLVEVPENNPLGAFGYLLPYLMVGLIWWVADFLTHDCTHTGAADETGLLDLGLLKKSTAREMEEDEGEKGREGERAKGGEEKSFADRYQDERQAEQKRHRPGTWLVVFSLAALPLFALGQLAIPAAQEERRRFVFWLLTLYVGCGLGLLLTTSFLGLRRYLRQRKLEMPKKLTAVWLGAGAALVLLLLVSATFLPRPAAEYSLPGLFGFAGSKKRDADKFAFMNFEGGQKQGPGGGQGQNGNQQQGNRGARDPNAQGPQRAEGKQGQGGQGNQGQPQGGGQKGQGQGKQQGQGQNGQRDGNNQKGEQQNQQPGDQQQGPKNNQQDGNQRDPNKQPNASAPDQNAQQNQQPGGNRDNREQAEQKDGSSGEANNSANPPIPEMHPPEPPSALAQLFKWLVILLLIALAIYLLVRYHKEILAWLQSLLSGWGWEMKTPATAAGAAAATAEAEPEPPPPFSSFVNPFDQPGRFRSNEEIVRYSFAALESWAYEQDLGRTPDETPHEFIRRLGARRPKLENSGKKVVDLYSLIVYAQGKAPGKQMDDVRRFWSELTPPRPRQAVGVE